MGKIGTDIEKAKLLLNQGEVVAIPTETVYGLAGNALDERSVNLIYKVKNRPRNNPLIIHIGRIEDINTYASSVPSVARVLAEKFWPGPLTMVLPKREIIPDEATSGLKTVGIRMPQHELTRSLIQDLDFPLAAPSANPFGYVSPTTAEHVADQLGDQIPYILDGGPCQKGLESTIIGFDNGELVLYRYGSISVEEIEKVIGHPLKIKTKEEKSPISPGMLPYHYAPTTPLLLSSDIETILSTLNEKRVAVVTLNNVFSHPNIVQYVVLSPSADLEEAGRKLYDTLRSLDKEKLDLIIIEKMPEYGLGLTINDRLERAAARN